MSLKKYTNRNPRSVRDQYLDDISFYSAQNIDIASLNQDIRVATITVGQTPQEVKVQAEALPDRHSVEITNDSSFLVYFGFSSDMQVGVDTLLINSGTSVTLHTNPNRQIKIYVVSPDVDAEIKIIEVS